MPFTTLNGLAFYYERRGSGQPLLLISGTGGDLRKKPRISDGPLSQHFDVLAYDQRGLGQSAKPDRPYAMADYADDAARLLDAVGWRCTRVLGISFGGMVAQELALRHPRRVERLVLACTSPGGAGGSSYPLHELAHLPADERGRRLVALGNTTYDDAWAKAHPELYAAFLAMAASDPYADEPGHAIGARRQLEARMGHNTWDRLDHIACPVLIAAGRFDGIAVPETQHRMAGKIPGSTLAFFEGGHGFMFEDPNALPAMAAFLADTP
jgi:3-oxoadipate enol-lactonase